MSDRQAEQLLGLLIIYLEAYQAADPTRITMFELAEDLVQSLPSEAHAHLDERLSSAGLR